MAEDAAGAVRRTPRPAPEPELIYGTTRTDPVGTVREHDDGTTAVKVSMGDDSTRGQHVWCWMNCRLEVRWLHHYDVAEWAVLAAPNERPVVLLPACACTYGEDCPHGPEPVDALDLAVWLHAEQSDALDAVDDALHGLDSDLGDDATLDARVKELHESYLDMVQLNGRWIDEIGQLKRELTYWRGRAETAEQRLKDAADFHPDVPPEPPIGTTYTNPDGTAAWVRREDGWHCGRTEPCRNCPCEWAEAWDFGARDPKLTRTFGEQPAAAPDFAEVRGELADGRRFTGRVDLRPGRELVERQLAQAAALSQHVYEDDAASNWEGICRVCSYPRGGPQHIDAPAEPTGEADRG